MITYSTNWMGPASLNWYRERGLTQTETKIATQNTMFYAIGETYTSESITTSYSCGRIDVRGIPDEPYTDEIGVPPMLTSDWQRFGVWLDDIQTMSVWSLENLVAAYEQHNPKITWADEFSPFETINS
jgi:hypothetical protein